MKPKLQILLASTREGRKGPTVADWFRGIADDHGGFEVEFVDLRDVALPLLDEPRHPIQGQYEHEHTRRWSAVVDGADAYAFVTAEYNRGAPPSLINALDHLFHEWAYKPVGFVSYGSVAGGTRSVEMTKQIATTLRMVPMVEVVAFPFFTRHLDEATGVFDPGEGGEKAARGMLDELLLWAEGLRPMREKRRQP